MRVFIHCLLIFSIGLVATNVNAQGRNGKRSKALQEMLEWQEQEERNEQFKARMAEAHTLFQQENYGAAKEKYKQALELKPNDQQTIAIITDLQILMDSIASTNNVAVTPIESEPLASNTNTLTMDEADPAGPRPPKTLEELLKNLPVRRPDITGISSSTEPAIASTEPERTPEPAPEPAPTPAYKPAPKAVTKVESASNNAKALDAMDKSTPEFESELAQRYEEGWTEEIIEEDHKKTIRRIHVADNKGTEYLRVEHRWGGIFHFRNGVPITENIWLESTETGK